MPGTEAGLRLTAIESRATESIIRRTPHTTENTIRGRHEDAEATMATIQDLEEEVDLKIAFLSKQFTLIFRIKNSRDLSTIT